MRMGNTNKLFVCKVLIIFRKVGILSKKAENKLDVAATLAGLHVHVLSCNLAIGGICEQRQKHTLTKSSDM